MADDGEHTEVHAREGRPPDGQPIGVYVKEQPSPVGYIDTAGQLIVPPSPSLRGSVYRYDPPWDGGGGGWFESPHLGYDDGDRASLGQLFTAVSQLQENIEAHRFDCYEAAAVISEQQAAERGVRQPVQIHQSPLYGVPVTASEPGLIRQAMELADCRERARILAAGPHRRAWWATALTWALPAACTIAASIPLSRFTLLALPGLGIAVWALRDRRWAAYRRACGCWACSASWWRHPFLRACLLARWLEPPKRHGRGPRDRAWWKGLHELEAAEGIEPIHDGGGNLLNTDDVEVA